MSLRAPLGMTSAVLVALVSAHGFGQVAPAVSGAATAASVTAPSALVRPSLATLQSALAGSRPEHWKISRSVRDATLANLSSIHRDLDVTLPPLVVSADAAPASIVALLPVSRNLGALYDVLLRVTVIAETTAPPAEIESLEGSLTSLDDARRQIGDRLASEAASENDQVKSLKMASSVAPASTAVVVPPPCTPPHVHRKKKPTPTT